MFEKFKSARPSPDLFEVLEIDPQELSEKREKVTIVDVRRPDEFTGELGHIPGSKLIVLDTLPDHMEQIPRDQTIVFVCRSGNRSTNAAAWALSEGYESVYNLKGGMILWGKLKLDIAKD
jgi:hydroxyacylglutathione hydrolase